MVFASCTPVCNDYDCGVYGIASYYTPKKAHNEIMKLKNQYNIETNQTPKKAKTASTDDEFWCNTYFSLVYANALNKLCGTDYQEIGCLLYCLISEDGKKWDDQLRISKNELYEAAFNCMYYDKYDRFDHFVALKEISDDELMTELLAFDIKRMYDNYRNKHIGAAYMPFRLDAPTSNIHSMFLPNKFRLHSQRSTIDKKITARAMQMVRDENI